jgi:phage replication O-like protein O
MHNSQSTRFQGFQRPTTTPIPDEVFDELMGDLTGAELKVLLYICRHTFGFKKESDTISLHQIAEGIVTKDGRVLDHGTGLSKRHVQRALKNLEEKHIIRVERRMDAAGVNEINTYALNFLIGVGTKSPYGRDKKSGGVGTPVSTTTNSRQQTVNNTVNGVAQFIAVCRR